MLTSNLSPRNITVLMATRPTHGPFAVEELTADTEERRRSDLGYDNATRHNPTKCNVNTQTEADVSRVTESYNVSAIESLPDVLLALFFQFIGHWESLVKIGSCCTVFKRKLI